MPTATWEPLAEQGFLDFEQRSDLPDSIYAFPRMRKEPLSSASHVIRALARLKTFHDVSDEDRDLAFVNILKAAEYYGVYVPETHWSQIGQQPSDAAPAGDAAAPVKPAGER